uniref:PDCD2_C domain-containing protein n=2 Tax=Macrostomum lignano TaxID=282301 RepID=A0A1I8HNU9_9PLAT
TMSGDLSTDINPLEIGCVDEAASTEPHKLLSHLFPSKIGGKPAWLALDQLPGEAQLRCCICSNRMTFLMQVYCPIESSVSATASDNADNNTDNDTFHRCLFFFMCSNGGCYGNVDKSSTPNAPVKVFRSQLARKNPYYPFEPPNYEASWSGIVKLIDAKQVSHPSSWQPLCALCGCPASGSEAVQCDDCNYKPGGLYCCKEHRDADATRRAEFCKLVDKQQQKIDGELLLRLWTLQSDLNDEQQFLHSNGRPLPELGLLIGPDPGNGMADDKIDMNRRFGDVPDDEVADDANDSSSLSSENVDDDVDAAMEVADDGERRRQQQQSSPTPMHSTNQAGDAANIDAAAGADSEANRSFNEFAAGIEQLAAKETPALKQLAEFKRATRREPGQVFRYQRHGAPLLISDQSVAPAPACARCGAARQFECQITPQLLNWLPLNESPDSVGPDFGSVLVYTCSRSCPLAGELGNYAEEFVAIQYV